MKKSLSGLDLIALAKELQPLVGGRIDKVYQPDKEMVELSLSTKEDGKVRLRARLDGWVWVSRKSEDMPLLPSSFAAQLRKIIGNARIIGISQHATERIIEISLQKDKDYRLILELFGEGNVILVSEGKIVALLKRRKMKHRDLKAKIEYAYPPATFDPRNSTKEELASAMRSSSADLVRTLATKVNLGGEFAEEICSRAGIGKESPAKDLTEGQMDSLWKEIGRLLGELAGNLRPEITLQNGSMTGLGPIPTKKPSGTERREFRSFSEAIEEYVSSLPIEIEAESEGEKQIGKLRRTLANQEKTIDALRREILGSKKIADFIYSHYKDVESAILSAAKGEGAEKGIKAVDRAAKSFRIAIDELELTLNWKKSVNENAQDYYDDIKRMKSKLDGAEKAAEETRADIARLERDAAVAEEKASKKRRKSVRAWYESYRWFFSSEGALVLAGKDAKSNDQLVKKHLQSGDRYVHADIHGAPSVVVKSKEGMSEQTLKEAAIFGLAMSKAWNAGIGSGSAYWVTPDQVSKTPQSGEFLPKGAWVIRGKRNYFERLEMRLAVGICGCDGEEKAMCGPLEAVSKNCRKFVEIVPGDTDKEKAAKLLAEILDVDVADVQSILPPGDLKMIG